MHFPHDTNAIASGALGVLWLFGLWTAAPVLGSENAAPAQRLAGTLALGCVIPLGLGLLNLLYWWSLWTVLLIVLAARLVRRGRTPFSLSPHDARPWDLLLGFAVLLALAWPIAVRPAIDGDTLIYHLPNAASWVVQHGVWTTGTRYWWYPPASELFAGGLLAVGGIGVVGWAGLLPGALLLLTARTVAQRSGAPALAGTLAACALLATPVAAVQLVSLQNDLWLAALFSCALSEYVPAAFAMLALTKPYGLLFALLAIPAWASNRKRLSMTLALSIGAVVLWAARDAVLLPHAIVPIGTTMIAGAMRTTIAAHMPHSIGVLAAASWRAGIAWVLFLALGIGSVFLAREPRLRWAALVSIGLFAIVPTGYAGGNGEQQLATGASLRFALPVAALGLLWLVSSMQRTYAYAAAAAAIGTIAGVAAQWRLFDSDAATHTTPLIATIAASIGAGSLLVREVRVRSAVAAGLCLVLGGRAAGLAESHPGGYIADAYGGGFAYAASRHFERVVTLGVPAGAAVTVDPHASAFDGLDVGVCSEAAALRAVIVTSLARLPDVACGRPVYADAGTAVIELQTGAPQTK